jgi:hypothetical protein
MTILRRLWKLIALTLSTGLLVAVIFTIGMVIMQPKGMAGNMQLQAVQVALSRLDVDEPDFKTMVVGASIETSLSPDQIWAELMDLQNWSSWCTLTRGSIRWVEGFHWVPGAQFQHEVELGFPLGSAQTVAFVEQVTPARSIVWAEQRRGARVCRVWQIDPLPNGGARLTCVEASRSLSTALTRLFTIGPMQRAFDETLGRLVKQASARTTDRVSTLVIGSK